ncbi:hypothetical protein [Bernardetia sp. MNP-M8]|uniref:hypothetical protein n=1 Tax=Bernardetia sp. MNP-M8 TaxID=3127470 RepID=UPI0030D48591
MIRIALFLLVCFIVSCQTENNSSVIENDSKDSVIVSNEKLKPKKNKWEVSGVIYKSDDFEIVGDTTIDKDKIYFHKLKFNPFIWFEDFEVSKKYKANQAAINYKSNLIARQYKTMLTQGYKSEGTNFAGHYSLITWGCGAPCVHGAIVDVIDGNVYDLPHSSIGYDFRKNSRMLIVNPTDSSGFYSHFEPAIFIWNEKKHQLDELKPREK